MGGKNTSKTFALTGFSRLFVRNARCLLRASLFLERKDARTPDDAGNERDEVAFRRPEIPVAGPGGNRRQLSGLAAGDVPSRSRLAANPNDLNQQRDGRPSASPADANLSLSGRRHSARVRRQSRPGRCDPLGGGGLICWPDRRRLLASIKPRASVGRNPSSEARGNLNKSSTVQRPLGGRIGGKGKRHDQPCSDH